jgi:uncharacterized protein (TIGR03437 family)
MLKRVSALCALGIAISTASLQAQDLFVLPGAQSASSEGQAFVTNPLTTYRTFSAGEGAFTILPNLAASTFFVVASSTQDSVVSTNTSLLSDTLVANLPAAATQAVMTPNGQVLAVAAGNAYLFSTATGNALVAGGVSQGAGVKTYAVAPSLDSSAVFALGTSGSASQINSISTSSYAVTATLALTQVATAVSVGPNGLVYVSLPGQILELDPLTLQPTYNGTISVSGTPGPLVFTPDGQFAASANQAVFSSSLIIVSLTNHSATTPSLGLPPLTSLLVTGTDSLLGLSSQALYQINLAPITVGVAYVPNLTGGVQLGAVTNDVPVGIHTAVQSAFLLSGGTIYEYSPSTQTVSSQFPVASGITAGTLSYVVPALTTSQSQPVSVLSFGNSQLVLPNGRSEPLVVQVLGTNNIPLSGVPVEFTTSGAAATLSTTSAVTGSNGYALVYLTAGDTSGPVTVTATAGSLSTNFSLNISTSAQSPGPTLTIVAGQGQLMLEQTNTGLGSQYGSPLQVLAADASGNPIAGVPVTFAVPSSAGTILVNGSGASSQIVTTNSSGIASVDFETTSLPPNTTTQEYFQTTVIASASATNSVTFYITTLPNNAVTTVQLLTPAPGSTITGAEGSTLANGLQGEILSATGYGIPNVSLSLIDDVNPATVPSISCNAPGGVALSNSNGFASCGLTFGPRLGTGSFSAVIGATHVLVPITFNVTTGPASAVQITQGNNQTGKPGQTLPLALVVHVTDSGGNTVQGATVTWQVVTKGAVTLSGVVGVTDSNGNASALATLGSTAGPAQVTATAGGATATFNLTVSIPTAGIQKISGDQQTAITDAAFATPLTVEVVDSSGNPVAGAQVNFGVTAGAATLNPTSAITNSAGQASTAVTAGATPGQLTVTATAASFSVNFTLTVLPPGPSSITIVNGASFDPNTGISPGGIALVRGMGILSGVSGVVSAPLTKGQYPTTFSGVTITLAGTPAPIYYVASANGVDQVAIQVPLEVQPGSSVPLEVSVASEGNTTVMVPVQQVAPGIFTSVYAGKPYAVAVRPDGSYVSPTNPAQRGEDILVYATGLGQATPTIATNTAGVADQSVVGKIVVGLNNGGVPLVSAVYAPGAIGLYVVTLHVPSDTATGPYQPVGLVAPDSVNKNHYAQPAYIPIQ